MASRRRRFLSTAAAEALVRFGPELSGLRELQRTAQSNFGISVHQAQAGSRGIQAAVALAKPDVAKIYDKAGLAQAQVAHTLIGSDLAGLGPSADRFKAAGATEAAGSANRLNEAKSNSLNDLTSRGVRAKEGEQFQIQQARTQFVNDLTKVLQRRQDLSREKGAYTASEVDKLAQDAADRQLRADIANASNDTRRDVAGVDASGNPLPGRHPDGRPPRPRAGTKPKWLTPEQNSRVVDAVNEAATWINRLQGSKHMTSHEIRQHLIAGDTLTDAKGNKLKLPKVPKQLVNAAYDIVAFGGLSQANVDALHRRRVKIKGNLPTRTGNLTAKQKKTFEAIFSLGS